MDKEEVLTCNSNRKMHSLSGKKCSHCKDKAVIYLPYAERYMCDNHLCRYVEKTFFKTLSEFKWIGKNDKVAVGLSGGKDSVVLLNLLALLKKKLPYTIIAITIDLGIDCDYNRKTIEIAKEECKRLNIPHYLFNLKEDFGYSLEDIVKKTKTQNPCSFCGVAKRYFLNKHARELGAKKIAIAHTLNDTAETIMMNILRNEPLRLFRYNEHLVDDEKFVPRIKPLIRLSEDEIIAYGKAKKFPILDKKCCPYSVFAFRKFVRLQLDELENRYPGTRFRILNSFLALQKIFRQQKNSFSVLHCKKCGEPSSKEVCKLCEMVAVLKNLKNQNI
ncbi:MAG: TIGR00269 family protein [Candidatus Bilamarchaeaceae archaeon]